MRSMTGYGQATVTIGKRSITAEVRAVNQRFLEVKFNMPREYLAWESELRTLVQERVGRGKIDVSFSRGGNGNGDLSVQPDADLAREYVSAWRTLQKELKLPGDIDVSFLLHRGEFVRLQERRSDASGDIDAVRTALVKALENFNREREREGKALAKDMLARTRRLLQFKKQIGGLVQNLKHQIEKRLRDRIEALLAGRELKEERLMQEVALLADRSDVTEELVRLGSHLAALMNLLKEAQPVGKKLDFLFQELNREFNTIASKSNDLSVTNLTMDAKSEIEKLREQALNIE